MKLSSLLPTASVDGSRVQQYAQTSGDKFPPVEYIQNGSNLYITDGNHRYFAALSRGDEEINAVPSGLPSEVKSGLLDRFRR
jgi:GT2 family glycosyltransferase